MEETWSLNKRQEKRRKGQKMKFARGEKKSCYSVCQRTLIVRVNSLKGKISWIMLLSLCLYLSISLSLYAFCTCSSTQPLSARLRSHGEASPPRHLARLCTCLSRVDRNVTDTVMWLGVLPFCYCAYTWRPALLAKLWCLYKMLKEQMSVA